MSARILVVDDDVWILRMVTTVLEKRGYTVDTACDGEEAFEKAMATIPDLLITDVMMPNMDGWTLVKSLRGQKEFAFVPVIFLTALGSDDDRIRGFRLGADDYLPKPFRFEELDLRVAKTIERMQVVEKRAREQLADKPSENTPSKADLTGNLSEVGISSLLVLMDMERKTGILTVTNTEDPPVSVRLFLKSGSPIAAEVVDQDSPKNEGVVYLILDWAEGTFAFQAAEIEQEKEIELSTTALLMEGARRIDEGSL
jgi:DNA-binding response OmpR family regulator